MKALIKMPIVIISLILLAVNCNNEDEQGHKEILIVNNSDRAIYFNLSYGYPDTAAFSNPVSDPYIYKVEKSSSKKDISRSYFEGTIKTNPKGTIMYFIFDAQTLETTPWDTVAKKYLI